MDKEVYTFQHNEHPMETHAKAFRLYAEGYAVTDIGKNLGVAVGTVRGWKAKEEWDLRCVSIYKQVLDKTGIDVIASACDTLKIIQGWKQKLLKRMETIPPHKIPIIMLKDIPELTRVEQQLLGQVSAYPGNEIKTDKNIPDHLRKLLNMPAHSLPAAKIKCESMGLDTNATTIAEVLAAAQLENVILGNIRITDVNIPDSNGSLEDALKAIQDSIPPKPEVPDAG